MPVTIHFGKLGEGCGVADDIGLPRLDRVLSEFPRLRILGHAMTFWSEMGADVSEETRNWYPKGRIEKEGRVSELMRKHAGLLCDISARSGLNAFLRDPDFAYKVRDEFHERIVVGTDISAPAVVSDTPVAMCEFLDEGYRSGNISRAAYENICRENALRLLSGEW